MSKLSIYIPASLMNRVSDVMRQYAFSANRDEQIEKLGEIMPNRGPEFEAMWPFIKLELGTRARAEFRKQQNLNKKEPRVRTKKARKHGIDIGELPSLLKSSSVGQAQVMHSLYARVVKKVNKVNRDNGKAGLKPVDQGDLLNHVLGDDVCDEVVQDTLDYYIEHQPEADKTEPEANPETDKKKKAA